MIRVASFILLFCCLALAEDLEQVKKELAAIDAETRLAMLRGDYDTLLKYYAEDAIVMPDFSPMIKGKSALRQQFEEDRRNGTVFHSFEGNVTKLWTCGNKVFQQGVFYVSMSNKYNDRPIALNTSYFTIWERQKDGRLLITYYIWNLDHPLQ